MRVFIREEKRDVHIRIYGIGGEQRTKEFFDAVFVDMSCVYPTTEKERAEYGTTGVYTKLYFNLNSNKNQGTES